VKNETQDLFLKAFQAGQESAKNKKSRNSNPFVLLSSEWIWWNEGFKSIQNEHP